MTVAVSAAVREGAEAVVCASTGNTAASAAAYAARAGLRGAVIVPEGKIATGKLAQALMHGARVIALRGNFDEALALVRELAGRAPDRAGELGERVPHRGPEDRRVRGLRRSWARRRTWCASRWATPATSPRGGKGFREYQRRAAHARLPGRGRGAAGARRARGAARDRGQRHPHRQPGPVGERHGRLHSSRGQVRAVSDDGDPRGVLAARRRARGCSASRPRPHRWPGLLKYGSRGHEWCACSRGTGSRIRRRP